MVPRGRDRLGGIPLAFCGRRYIGSAEPRYFLRDADRLPFGTHHYSIPLFPHFILLDFYVSVAASVYTWLGGKATYYPRLNLEMITY